jgi:hypothetical protein
LFDLTDGVDVSSIRSTSADVGSVLVEGVFSTACGVHRSATGGAGSMMEINSAASSSCTWKLNNPRVISKPPILVEVSPVKHETGSTMAVARMSIATMRAELMKVGEAMPTTAGKVMLMMVGDAVSMSM